MSRLPLSLKESILREVSSAYNEAATTLEHWGVGGDYSRALSVVTNIVVGSTAGQGTTQLASNALAPYAAELIGNTFAHTDKSNEAAQLLSHAVLGGVLAYVNGGNAASGAGAGAGAEAAALIIAKELYPNAFVNGVLDRSKLTEEQANAIVALSSGIGALVGEISGGGLNGATIDANVAGNAVENNAMSTDPRLNRFYGEGLSKDHFLNRFQSDTAKGFAGLENGLDRLYNLDTSKMSPVGRTAFDYLNLKVITVPGTSESQINLMDHSSERLTNEIKKDLKQ